jgi:hypothetical protein
VERSEGGFLEESQFENISTPIISNPITKYLVCLLTSRGEG